MQKDTGQIIEQLNNCAAACNHCFQACLDEEDVSMMARCIELDRECAEICQLTASFLMRDSEHAHELLSVCAKICDACGDECAKHDKQHCQRCAEACRHCAEACKELAV